MGDPVIQAIEGRGYFPDVNQGPLQTNNENKLDTYKFLIHTKWMISR